MKRTGLIIILMILGAITILTFSGCGNPTGGGSDGGGASRYTLSIVVTPEGAGTVEVYPTGETTAGGKKYPAGTTVIVTVEPLGIRPFDHWAGDLTGSSTSAAILMNGNKRITASFQRLYFNLNCSVSPDGSGTIEPWGGEYIDYTSVILSADAAADYLFDHWEIGGADAGSINPTIETMTSTKDVKAVFARSIIYVSDASGSDGNDGSSSHPVKTIQKGLDKVAAGGKVSVEAGIYTENLVWPTTKDNITLSGASMTTTTLDANYSGTGIDIEKAGSSKLKAAKIEKIMIVNGTSSTGGAGIYFNCYGATGAGQYAIVRLFEVYIYNCSAEGAATYGGGIYAKDNGGGHYGESTLEAIKCIIKNNTALSSSSSPSFGGGMYLSFIHSFISSCEVSYNLSSGSGGGMAISDPNWTAMSQERIENTIIHHNKAQTSDGGGLYSSVSNTYNNIINCTVASNEAPGGKGGGIYTYWSRDKVTNCILWGDTASSSNEIYYYSASAPTVTYSDIQGGFSGSHNVNEDPGFETLTDFHIDYATSNVYAGGTSSGAPAVDYEGNPRTGSYSMGAYEKD